jgi:uncharacterized protein
VADAWPAGVTIAADPQLAESPPRLGAPGTSGSRIVVLDAIRGVAVLGILLMNIVGMGLPFGAYENPAIFGMHAPADYWVWAVNAVVAEGKMRAIFSILFGASALLLIRQVEARGGRDTAADIHLRRNLWLLLFGFVHGYLLLWPGEILFTYGVAGVALYVFRRVRPRNLIVLGVVVLALQTPKLVFRNMEMREAASELRRLTDITSVGGTLTPEQRSEEERLRNTSEQPTPESLQRTIDERHVGYLQSIVNASPENLYLETMYLYKVGFWDAFGPMLIGMALLEIGVLSGARSTRFYLRLAAAGYAASIPLAIWAVADWTRHGFAQGARWVSLDEVIRVPGALGHIAVVVLLYKSGIARPAVNALAAVGRMALTNYILQTVICVTLFGGFGFGWFGHLARHQLYYIVAAVWTFEIALSTLWFRGFRIGPLEWVWRSVTYQQRQPFRLRRSRRHQEG